MQSQKKKKKPTSVWLAGETKRSRTREPGLGSVRSGRVECDATDAHSSQRSTRQDETQARSLKRQTASEDIACIKWHVPKLHPDQRARGTAVSGVRRLQCRTPGKIQKIPKYTLGRAIPVGVMIITWDEPRAPGAASAFSGHWVARPSGRLA